MQPRSPSRSATPRIEELIARRDLSAVFQPIIDFDDGAILGYEGLIRGPAGTPLEAPFALFSQALAEGCALELEQAAARTCIDAFAKLDFDGKLFLNFSAGAIRQLADAHDETLALLRHRGVDPQRIVIELTEQSTIPDIASFLPVISALRTAGAQFALDDYGTANASMNLWVRLQPDVVKIDRFFIHGIANDPLKFEAVKAMQYFAKASGARLIAEGIDNMADLIVVRDMGISCGQGFYFGRPDAQPLRLIDAEVTGLLHSKHIAVFPEPTRDVRVSPSGGMAATKMMVHAPALPRHAINNDVLELFNRLPELHAVAIVENDQPVALINRRGFMERYALPYHRELFGKRSCLQFAHASPVIFERSITTHELSKLLASDDKPYLADRLALPSQ